MVTNDDHDSDCPAQYGGSCLCFDLPLVCCKPTRKIAKGKPIKSVRSQAKDEK